MTYAADCRSELGGIEWLDDPARSARRTRASLFLFRTFSRQDQDRTVAMAPIRTQGVDQAKAVHARHVDVSNDHVGRSEEHTSELQSLMRISYAVYCLKKQQHKNPHPQHAHLKHQLTHSILHITTHILATAGNNK